MVKLYISLKSYPSKTASREICLFLNYKDAHILKAMLPQLLSKHISLKMMLHRVGKAVFTQRVGLDPL